jgi:hypothetical protein
VEFKIVKVRKLSIKEVMEFFVEVFFLFENGISIWEYKDKSDRIIVGDNTFLKTYTKLLNYELLCFLF